MQKIISLFQRNYDGDRLVRDEIVPGAEWVVNGEGVATVKHDGTCCMVDDGVLYKRFDAKRGKQPPLGFQPAQEPDEQTGHWPGWVPVHSDDPASRWHCEAVAPNPVTHCNLPDGTYELVGPKVQGNPYHLERHVLWAHGHEHIYVPAVAYEGLREFLRKMPFEGVVWHHPDGRMVKIKRRDFGFPWPTKD